MPLLLDLLIAAKNGNLLSGVQFGLVVHDAYDSLTNNCHTIIEFVITISETLKSC